MPVTVEPEFAPARRAVFRSEASLYLASLLLDIDAIAAAIRGHWGVEAMPWMLDVLFEAPGRPRGG